MAKFKVDKKDTTPEKPNEKQAKKDVKTVQEPEVKTVQNGSDIEAEKILNDMKFLSRLLAFILVLFLSFATRFYNLSDPTHIW